MQKEKIPKFFTFDIVNAFLTVVPFIAIFGFWEKLKDSEKIMYIIIPAIGLFLLVNVIRYCHQVKKFDLAYDKLYENNQALAENYKKNIQELKQQEYNNQILREFSKNTMAVLITYNDMTKEQRNDIKQKIISDFIDKN